MYTYIYMYIYIYIYAHVDIYALVPLPVACVARTEGCTRAPPSR